ncbi:hypothetical protein EZV73_26560 [Acidaminobacter sp. JC074]|uniref:hypothetical protein n=1 Tax=Acidaminobacter sp. JC074 TaxID=2530199 RepID=UPI001F0F01E9|nr:hypothetical protein [Acidaminobacter sp. JC074]MCH4891169.1 hypothetical protein [Acidaminobacter sp. JC074]
MIFIQTGKNDEVTMQHYRVEMLSENEIELGFLVEEVPEPEKNNKQSQLYYTEEKGFWYIYSEGNQNDAEKIAMLVKENQEIKAMIADLGLQIGGGL